MRSGDKRIYGHPTLILIERVHRNAVPLIQIVLRRASCGHVDTG